MCEEDRPRPCIPAPCGGVRSRWSPTAHTEEMGALMKGARSYVRSEYGGDTGQVNGVEVTWEELEEDRGVWVSDAAWEVLGATTTDRMRNLDCLLDEIGDEGWSAIGVVRYPDGRPVNADAEPDDHLKGTGPGHMCEAVREYVNAASVRSGLEDASITAERREDKRRQRFAAFDGAFFYDLGSEPVAHEVEQVEVTLNGLAVLDETYYYEVLHEQLVNDAFAELESMVGTSLDAEDIAGEFADGQLGYYCPDCAFTFLEAELTKFLESRPDTELCAECSEWHDASSTEEVKGERLCTPCAEGASQVDIRKLVSSGDLVVRDAKGRIVQWDPLDRQWVECPWRWREVLNK